jgi:tRNA threonylcarbamoyl adenosine modification protein (Sua5/YciO/YrdC/YwlC family)
MQIYTKEEVETNSDIKSKVVKGEVFVYPTDTIYGLGCNGFNKKAVAKVRELKQRPTDPFSVIAPSKEWILANCVVTKQAQEWIDKLPGPYTLIFKLKNKNAVAENVHPGTDTLGVRIPKHWIADLANSIDTPIVTTSANKHGGNFMTTIDDLDEDIKKKVNFILYEGEKKGRPSALINLASEEVVVKKR